MCLTTSANGRTTARGNPNHKRHHLRKWKVKSITDEVEKTVAERMLDAVVDYIIPTAEDELTSQELLRKTQVLDNLADSQDDFADSLYDLKAAICEGKKDRNMEWTAFKDARTTYYSSWDEARMTLRTLDGLALTRIALPIVREKLIDQLPDEYTVENHEVQDGAECAFIGG